MSTRISSEERPGLSLPGREREALNTLMRWRGVGPGSFDGESSGHVVARYYEGWRDAHLWQGLYIPLALNGVRRLVHGWSGETLESDPPVRVYSAKSVYDVYADGDARVVEVPLREGESGPRPDQIASAYDMLREFADRPAPERPSSTSERVYRIAQNLPDDLLRGAAVWMLDEAVATQPSPMAA